MDWDWKNFGWDITDLGKDEIGLSILGTDQKNQGDDGSEHRLLIDELMVSTPRSPKRIRVVNGSGAAQTNLTCLVDGCNSDLSNCKDYHRRHRVCERHSKTPVVTVRGEEKRFCQQCSRFHALDEFDEVKRSCRKRLDGHNRRRRKPQPESIYMSSKDFLSNFKGPRILQFSNPQMEGADIGGSLWPFVSRTESEATAVNNRHKWMQVIDQKSNPNSSARVFYAAGDKQISLLQKSYQKDGNQATQISVCQPLPFTIASIESERGSTKMLPNGISQPDGMDSGCALYLLSSHPTQASGIGLSCLFQTHLIHQLQPQESGLHSSSYGSKDNKPRSPIPTFDASKSSFHEDMLVQMRGPDSLFEAEVSSMLPTSWE